MENGLVGRSWVWILAPGTYVETNLQSFHYLCNLPTIYPPSSYSWTLFPYWSNKTTRTQHKLPPDNITPIPWVIKWLWITFPGCGTSLLHGIGREGDCLGKPMLTFSDTPSLTCAINLYLGMVLVLENIALEIPLWGSWACPRVIHFSQESRMAAAYKQP